MNTQLVDVYTREIIPVLQKYAVKKAAFFGSLVVGKFKENKSDVDILVLPPHAMSLLDFVGLKQDIEDVIHQEVDLVSYNGISPYLKESILREQHIFYETQ